MPFPAAESAGTAVVARTLKKKNDGTGLPERKYESGMERVRAARADGRWEAAYAPASEMTIPDDFLTALKEHAKAKVFFETLNRQNLYAIAYRLQTAKNRKRVRDVSRNSW